MVCWKLVIRGMLADGIEPFPATRKKEDGAQAGRGTPALRAVPLLAAHRAAA
jgi:hypothetical protein